MILICVWYRNGWGASAADALSTAIIMDLPDVVNVIVVRLSRLIPLLTNGQYWLVWKKHIDTVDYSKTDSGVSLFETTIRYLGGMLSGYDLLDAGACSSCDVGCTRSMQTPWIKSANWTMIREHWTIACSSSRRTSPIYSNSHLIRRLAFRPIIWT